MYATVMAFNKIIVIFSGQVNRDPLRGRCHLDLQFMRSPC